MQRQQTSRFLPLLVMVMCWSMTASAQGNRVERTVTVSATGSVSVQPDIARIATGVVSEAETARDALQRNSATMKKVIDGLKAAGIDAADLQTSDLSIHPRYDQPKDGRAPKITGYRVSNQVRITARDMSRLGELLDTLVKLGANEAGGISFDVSNAETLRDEARRQAIANALRRARLYAEASGAAVGAVLTISEDVFAPEPRPYAKGRVAMSGEAVPIEQGSQSLEARVQVTWELK